MGKETGFIEYERENQTKRPVKERIKDFNQIYIPMNYEKVRIHEPVQKRRWFSRFFGD